MTSNEIHTTLSSSLVSKSLNYENFILNDNKAGTPADNNTESVIALSDTAEAAATVAQTETKAAAEKILKAGEQSEDVKLLQTNLKKLGFFNGEVTGLYGDITAFAVKNFQKANSLPANGEANEATVEKLNYFASRTITVASRGTSRETAAVPAPTPAAKAPAKATPKAATGQTSAQPAGKGGVSMLNWFGSAQNVFSIGSVATVTDLNTGIAFKVKRTYGTNHADCEALTAADTAKMLQAAGGSWNWTRRPVIVEVNGQKIAASLAPFPHAGRDDVAANVNTTNRSGDYGSGTNLDSVKGNNMNGHFDIHFLGSKTHGSNQVDANHQAAVKRAYELGN